MAKGDRVNPQREATQPNREAMLTTLLGIVSVAIPSTTKNLKDVGKEISGGQKERSR